MLLLFFFKLWFIWITNKTNDFSWADGARKSFTLERIQLRVVSHQKIKNYLEMIEMILLAYMSSIKVINLFEAHFSTILLLNNKLKICNDPTFVSRLHTYN